MRSLWVLLLFLGVACAGCSDPGPADVDDGVGAGDGATADGLAAPTWALGDWWTYEGPQSDFTLVVSEDRSNNWFIDTDDVDLAFFEAEFGPVSYMGLQRKSDLAGSQDPSRVAFFDFPLQDGKQWTARWDGEEMDLVAHDLGNEEFHIIASVDDTVRNEYQYSNATRWFDWISFKDPDGNEAFRMDLTESGRGYTGDVVRVDADLIASRHLEGPQAQEFTMFGNAGVIDADDADMYILFAATCATGAYSFALGTIESLTNAGSDLGVEPGVFEDQGYSTAGTPCPDTRSVAAIIGFHPGNGDHWGYLVNSDSPDLVLDFDLYLRNIERITL